MSITSSDDYAKCISGLKWYNLRSRITESYEPIIFIRRAMNDYGRNRNDLKSDAGRIKHEAREWESANRYMNEAVSSLPDGSLFHPEDSAYIAQLVGGVDFLGGMTEMYYRHQQAVEATRPDYRGFAGPKVDVPPPFEHLVSQSPVIAAFYTALEPHMQPGDRGSVQASAAKFKKTAKEALDVFNQK